MQVSSVRVGCQEIMKNNIEETHTIYQDAHLLRAQLRTLPINNPLDEELANLTTEIEVTLKTCITTKGMFEHGAKMLNQNLQGLRRVCLVWET